MATPRKGKAKVKLPLQVKELAMVKLAVLKAEDQE